MTSGAAPVRLDRFRAAWGERALVTAFVTVGALLQLVIGKNEPTIITDPYDDSR